ncbi:MAG: DNA recombination protein RmuC [Candidatus Carbobacillus altaicus]|uniref:DNA recombination protein RmuC n=1 Tax=Candidatus Carbonibacillus altaicus TaxID=2163959 RepID=A0A2R6Y4R0_9BACL|nr:MAG: DNA recombination protein RmuC [Candidatus Carbobacillus altaicus]
MTTDGIVFTIIILISILTIAVIVFFIWQARALGELRRRLDEEEKARAALSTKLETLASEIIKQGSALDSTLRITEQSKSTVELTHAVVREMREGMTHFFDRNIEHGDTLRREIRETLDTFSGQQTASLKLSADAQERQLGAFQKQLGTFQEQLKGLFEMSEARLERMRVTVEGKLTQIQKDNSEKLEAMRQTVDEKLHATLERRLGESFQMVSERLEQVYKGLGEMQTLASGVGDLKKVLSNIRTRGTLGEIQLTALLEQFLSPEQYAYQVHVSDGRERVDVAIRLPGKKEDAPLWLPIDSKFPMEDYERLLYAEETGDAEGLKAASKALEDRLRQEARSIRDKYINPPQTTDFALLFVPTEGLFAEVLRRPGLWDELAQKMRIVVVGPTTLTAFLNSLQMGFRTLAIEKRSSEVWTLLGAVRTEFGKFAGLLEKTQKKLHEASKSIEDASRKTRTIERRLKDVTALPQDASTKLLGMAEEIEEIAVEDEV